MTTIARTPYTAAYNDSAAPALPAVGTARVDAPRASAIGTATAMPRALNVPVGLSPSSLTCNEATLRRATRPPLPIRSNLYSGVPPSPRERISASFSGSSGAYRHKSFRAGRSSRRTSLHSYRANSGAPQSQTFRRRTSYFFEQAVHSRNAGRTVPGMPATPLRFVPRWLYHRGRTRCVDGNHGPRGRPSACVRGDGRRHAVARPDPGRVLRRRGQRSRGPDRPRRGRRGRARRDRGRGILGSTRARGGARGGRRDRDSGEGGPRIGAGERPLRRESDEPLLFLPPGTRCGAPAARGGSRLSGHRGRGESLGPRRLSTRDSGDERGRLLASPRRVRPREVRRPIARATARTELSRQAEQRLPFLSHRASDADHRRVVAPSRGRRGLSAKPWVPPSPRPSPRGSRPNRGGPGRHPSPPLDRGGGRDDAPVYRI